VTFTITYSDGTSDTITCEVAVVPPEPEPTP
jgi:hypothetical protein